MAEKKKNAMPGIETKRNRQGEIVSYKFRCCVGRDEQYRQIWRTATIPSDDPRIDGLTPGKLAKTLNTLKSNWDDEQRAAYEKEHTKTDKRREKQKITLAKFVTENWLNVHVLQSTLKPSTKAFYQFMAADILDYFPSRTRLSEIDRESIESFEIYLRSEAKTKRGMSLSDTSVRRHLETLRNVLQYAKVNKYLSNNPFEDYPIANKAEEAEVVDYLSPAEISSFYNCLESESKFWQLYIRLSLLCGLRRGEMVGLKWSDFDTSMRRIVVQRNVTVDSSSEKGFSIGSTKTKKRRVVYYTEAVANLLEAYKSELMGRYTEFPEDGFVFCTPTDPNCPIYPTTPTTWLRRFEEKNGLRAVSPHDLRHTTGTLAKLAGYSNKDIQSELGHSDSKTTEKFYVAVDERALQSIPEDIERMISQHDGK